MSEAPPDSPYLTTGELAAILGKSVEAVRGMRQRRTGPQGKRFGRNTLYLRDEVQAWLEEKRDTDPLLYYRPEVQAWLRARHHTGQQRQMTASAA